MIATLVREKNKDAFLNLLSDNKYDKNELIIDSEVFTSESFFKGCVIWKLRNI